MIEWALLYLKKPDKLTYLNEENTQKHTSAHLAGVQLNHMEQTVLSTGKKGR